MRYRHATASVLDNTGEVAEVVVEGTGPPQAAVHHAASPYSQ
ncbi:hypothetical protein [Streptomyces sp. NBC_00859]|nr:hypothetical protein OG584_03515 [Streptomyces sp. NBC_00859]